MKNTAVYIIILLSGLAALQSCKTNTPVVDIGEYVDMDTVTIDASSKRYTYRASEKRVNDLLHTKLEVSFNWDSAYLYGKAYLKLAPYFYPVDSLVLDAKGFRIKEISLVDNIGKRSALNYTYDSSFIHIALGKTYTRKDTYNIFVEYTAMPNKLKNEGSAAITQDKGLYFINPDGSDPDKPKQIWTQGETEASSCWFPTIDSPNERTTQEIYITVDSQYVTLSNGELIFQTENPNGSRTDYWKQDLPHAPYLFMMAIGEFAVVEDEWRNIPVNYYVEPEFKAYAKDIYPNTTEMLEFFSTKLGYDYPWDKYHQVVVRDYVSGAMENTGAVIFGDFIQGNDRFLIDNAGEDIVAHEMFHHWFGDLVTCESWSNLPLNESFATYGEFLWMEHKYGKDQADYHLWNDLRTYLRQSQINKKKMIRFHYENEMEMFDAHSYQKGGRILHMLRKHVGDDAFFKSLQLYLKQNEFKSVEIHNLRLAFEEVTGEDLNWFFNQWFLGAGHPILSIEKKYNALNDSLTVNIKQTQDGMNVAEVFEVPSNIIIMQANGVAREEKIRLTEKSHEYHFKLSGKPQYVLFDSDHSLIAEVNLEQTVEEAINSFTDQAHFITKYNALKKIQNSNEPAALRLIEKALTDDFWFIRQTAIENIENVTKQENSKAFETLKMLAEKDEKSNVRAAAYYALAKYYKDKVDVRFLEKGINDPSYLVVSSSLNAIAEADKQTGLRKASELEKEDNVNILMTIAYLYAEDAKPEHKGFYKSAMTRLSGFNLYPLITSYGEFTEQQDKEVIMEALPDFRKIAAEEDAWYLRMAAINAMVKIKENNEMAIEEINTKLPKTDNPESMKMMNREKADAEEINAEIISIFKDLEPSETNANLSRILNSEISR